MLRFLYPHYRFDAITRIRRRWLKQQEIYTVLLDLDRTLLSLGSKKVMPDFTAWLTRKQQQGFRFCLLSNGRTRLERLAEELDIPCFTPFSKILPSACRKAMRELYCDPQYTAVISDRTLGGIVAANLAGIRSIHVKPLRPAVS